MLTDFIVADLADAATILNTPGHAARWPTLQTNGVDNSMLAALWGVLSPNAPTEQLEGTELVIQEANGGPWVFHLPQELVGRLATIDETEFSAIASKWAEQDEPRYANCRADDLEAGLRQVAAIAQQAREANKPLLLWMSL